MKKNLWQKKYFGRLFSVFALSIFLFGNVPNVKASEFIDESSLMIIDNINDTITINSSTNDNLLLICYADNRYANNFVINNETSTRLLNGETNFPLNYVKKPKNWNKQFFIW